MYQLLPIDTTIEADYQAYWFQMEIDPGKGWCATRLHFDMDAPSDGRIVSAVPHESTHVRSRSIGTTHLSVDGDGAAVVTGAIEQEVVLTPGRTRVRIDDDHYNYDWRGLSRHKVMVAIGVQLSSARTPPELFTTWSESEGGGVGSCRPMRVEVTSG